MQSSDCGDSWAVQRDTDAHFPVQPTDDTDVKQKDKFSTAVSVDESQSLESGYSRLVLNIRLYACFPVCQLPS